MRIARIKLDNYRCHGHFEQSFPLGINLLLGKNGSGKSSVLEAIGMIVCGDSGRAASESGAVGPLKKHANIEIEFIDRDNVRWLAKKRIGAGGHAVRLWRWQGSGWQLEKSGILPGLFGLSKKDAKTVYQTMIVAEQNQFTLPFLATSTNRRTIFDSVFGISQWHELGTKSGLETPYSQSVSAFQARLETLEEQLAVSERSELEAEEATLEQRIRDHESEIRLLDTARQNAVSLASAFRRVDESQQEAKRMQERLSELSQRVETFEQDLAWLEKNAPSLERFEILEHQLELLRACHETALGVEAARTREETSEARLVEVRAECTRLSERL